MMLPDPAHDKLHDIAENRPEQREDCHDCCNDSSRLRRDFGLHVPQMRGAKPAFARGAVAPLSRRAEIKTGPVRPARRAARRGNIRTFGALVSARPMEATEIAGLARRVRAFLFSINL